MCDSLTEGRQRTDQNELDVVTCSYRPDSRGSLPKSDGVGNHSLVEAVDRVKGRGLSF